MGGERLFKLRYKTFPVMDLMIQMGTKEGFTVTRVTKIADVHLLPYSLRGIKSENMPAHFMRWYKSRVISPDSPVISNIAYLISETEDIEIEDPYAFVVNASLLSYGRTLTDKYWIAPVPPKGHETYFKSGIKPCALNSRIITHKRSYAGMDYHTGFNSNSFMTLIEKGKQVKIFDFNNPGLCIPGSKIKYPIIDTDGNIWIKKLSDDYEEALAAHQKAPEIFPKVAKNSNGYFSRVFTSRTRELVHTTEILEAIRDKYERGMDQEIESMEDLLEKLRQFIPNAEEYKDQIEAARKIIGNDEKLILNSGFLATNNFGEYAGFKAWI